MTMSISGTWYAISLCTSVVAVDPSVELIASGSVQNRSRVETVSSKGSNCSPGEKKKGKKR